MATSSFELRLEGALGDCAVNDKRRWLEIFLSAANLKTFNQEYADAVRKVYCRFWAYVSEETLQQWAQETCLDPAGQHEVYMQLLLRQYGAWVTLKRTRDLKSR